MRNREQYRKYRVGAYLERIESDPEYRAKINTAYWERYYSDPEFNAQERARKQRHNIARRAIEGSYTQAQWEILLDLCGNRCVECGNVTKLEVDHIVPVSENGTSNIWNLQPLCRSCNASKGTTIADYRPDEAAFCIEAGYI